MTTVSPQPTGGTDHQSFDAVGLPGFQFIQDPLEYSTRTHHTNQDVYERLMQDDLKQNAVIIASFAYHAAMRDEKLPRKPLPKPAPDAADAGDHGGELTRAAYRLSAVGLSVHVAHPASGRASVPRVARSSSPWRARRR